MPQRAVLGGSELSEANLLRLLASATSSHTGRPPRDSAGSLPASLVQDGSGSLRTVDSFASDGYDTVGTSDTDSASCREEMRTTTGLTIQRTASGIPVVNKQYLLVKRLGEGAQGKVKLVLNLQDMSLYAIKFISKKHLRTSIRRMSKSSRRSTAMSTAVRSAAASAAAAMQPARTHSMPLTSQLHRKSMTLSLCSSRSSSEAAKLSTGSFMQRALSMPPPQTDTAAASAAVATAAVAHAPCSAADSAISSLCSQLLAPRLPARQKRVRTLSHRPPTAARTFPPALRAQLLSSRLAARRSTGLQGKSRSKSEQASSESDASTASAEMFCLRQHSACKRESPAELGVSQNAAGHGNPVAALISTSGSAHGAQTAAHGSDSKAALADTHAATQAELERAPQAATTSVGSVLSAFSTVQQQHSEAASGGAAAAKPKRRRQRANSHGAAVSTSRTMSVPAMLATADLRTAQNIRQPGTNAAAPVSEEAAPAGGLGHTSSSSSASAHRRRRSRSTEPLSLATLTAHAATEASLKTQSVSTVSLTSCPKLDELLTVLRASGTAAKQNPAVRSTKTYSEPLVPLYRSRCAVQSPFAQPGHEVTDQQQQAAQHAEAACDYRSLAQGMPSAAAVPAQPTSSVDRASTARTAPGAADGTAMANSATAADGRGKDHSAQPAMVAAVAVEPASASNFSSVAATSRELDLEPRTPVDQLRAASAAVSPFAAPELQTASTDGTADRRTEAVTAASSSGTEDQPVMDIPAAVHDSELPVAQSSRCASGSGATCAQPSVEVPQTTGAAGGVAPLNDYLAMIGAAQSLEPPSSPATGRKPQEAYQSPFMQSRLASAPPRLPRLDSKEPFNGPLLHTSYSAAVAAAISAVDTEAAAATGDHLSSFGSGSLMSDTLLPANLQAAATARPRTADAAVPPFGTALPSAPSQTDRIELLKRRSVTPAAEGGTLPTVRLASMMSAGSSASGDLVREIAVLKKLDHPNVVKLREVIDDPSSDSLLLVMEYVAGGSLEQAQVGPKGARRWVPVPEAVTLRYVQEICQGLEYLHANHVVHGDLKPANLLRGGDGHIKIVDFGSALVYQETAGAWDGQVSGTPAFRAPESLKSGYKLTHKVDNWAVGVCIYQWTFGRLPFSGTSTSEVFDSISNQPLMLPPEIAISATLADLIALMLTKDPAKRPSLAAVMRHPWMARAPAPLTKQPSVHNQELSISEAEVTSAISHHDRNQMMTELLPIFQEVIFEPGEELHASRSRASEETAILLIVNGHVDTVLMPSGARLSRASSGTASSTSKEDLWGGGGSANGDDFSFDGDAIGSMSLGSITDLLSEVPRPIDLGFGQLLLQSRGPGELFFGLAGAARKDVRGSSNGRKAVHRARGHVLAYETSTEQMSAALKRNPALADLLDSTAWQHTSDSTISQVTTELHLSTSALIATGMCPGTASNLPAGASGLSSILSGGSVEHSLDGGTT